MTDPWRVSSWRLKNKEKAGDESYGRKRRRPSDE